MADKQPPLALKAADNNLYKTANRGVQLATAKPIVAYWCEFYVVNQILTRDLHHSGPELMEYSLGLMEKLEKAKKTFANEEAVTDEAVAKVYIEQFAQDTLDRAQKVIRANKCTQQTATTFDAAATFFNLLNNWGDIDADTKQKIKYAKWNALRILKALKEGTDPNESNPKPEPLPTPLDPEDPDVQAVADPSSVPRPVEDGSDTTSHRGDAPASLPHTPFAPQTQPQEDTVLPDAPLPGDESQFSPTAPSQQQHGYFDPGPSMPSPMSPPLQPSAAPNDLPPRWTPTPPPAETAGSRPQSSYSQDHNHQALGSVSAPPTFAPSPAAMPAIAPPPAKAPGVDYMANLAPNPLAAGFGRPTIPVQAAAPAAPSRPSASNNYTPDIMDIAEVQKHCRYVISALDHEDFETALKLLRGCISKLEGTS